MQQAGTVPQHGQSWMEFGRGSRGRRRQCREEGAERRFWNILTGVLGSERLLQAQLVTNWPCEFVHALEWKGNVSSPRGAQYAADLILNVHSS